MIYNVNEGRINKITDEINGDKDGNKAVDWEDMSCGMWKKVAGDRVGRWW